VVAVVVLGGVGIGIGIGLSGLRHRQTTTQAVHVAVAVKDQVNGPYQRALRFAPQTAQAPLEAREQE